MSRASARQVHCKAVIPYVECTNAVPNCTRLATSLRIGGLRTRGGAVSRNSTASTVFASLDIARRFHATSTATLKSFKSRVSQLLQRAGSHSESAIRARSHSPASDRQARRANSSMRNCSSLGRLYRSRFRPTTDCRWGSDWESPRACANDWVPWDSRSRLSP